MINRYFNIFREKYNLISSLFFLLGLLSTWSAIIIKIGSTQLALYNVILVVLIIVMFREFNLKTLKREIKGKFLVLLFFAALPLSTFMSLILLYNSGDLWFQYSLRGTMKFLILLLPLTLIVSKENILKYRDYFFTGLFYSAGGHLIWEFLQLIFWTNARISLNELIFGNFLGINIPDASWTLMMHINGVPQFRPTGLGWDASAMALVLVIGFILSTNMYQKIGFTLGIFLSASRTGIIIWGLCLLISIFYDYIYVKFHRIQSVYRQNKRRIIFSLISIIAVFIIFIFLFHKNIIDYLLNNLLNSNDSLGNFSAQRHASYYLELFDLFLRSNILHIIFGYGTFIAGFPYAVYYGFYNNLIGWTPESDFITMLVGNGIVGFMLYYASFLVALFRNIKYKKNFMILIAILISGIFYLYIRGSWTIIVLILLYPKKQINHAS